jgi:hypothetical protein
MADLIARALEESIPWSTPGELFTSQLLGVGRWPTQGWKIHVSATPGSAPAVLARTLPILLRAGVRFKVVNSLQNLSSMNSGLHGDTQVGKFITVYPSDDSEAVGLASQLHSATVDYRGPRVPTDRPLQPGSLVHYRYGIFRSSEESGFRAGGDLSDPAGRWTTDWRCTHYVSPPPEIPDPFEAAGIVITKPARKGALGGRFIVLEAINRSWRGGIYRAIDLSASPPRQCLLKELWRDVGSGENGWDSTSWTNNETRILYAHGDGVTVPRCFGDVEVEGNHYVVLEFVHGVTLDMKLAGRVGANVGLPVPEIVSIGLGAASALSRVQSLGVIYRDFKPGNLILETKGNWRLIDFGIAYDTNGLHPPVTGGTPAFCSPQQWNGEDPTPSDDVFSWGTMIYSLACGLDSLMPPNSAEDHSPHARPRVRDNRPSIPPALAFVIDRACSCAKTDRYRSMAEVEGALTSISSDPVILSPREDGTLSATPLPSPIRSVAAMDEAVTIGSHLCDTAVVERGGLSWMKKFDGSNDGIGSPDLYDGSAGVVLYLAALAKATGTTSFADAARGGARWLAGSDWSAGRAAPGLHCGEAGTVITFLRLKEFLGEDAWLSAADIRARRLRGVTLNGLDLIYGAAGLAVALAEVAEATNDSNHLVEADRAGSILLGSAKTGPGHHGVFWNIPSGDPSLAPSPLLGLAHGAAGVALALIHLYRATADERYLTAAEGAGEMLLHQAVKGADGGWRWPLTLGGDRLNQQAWCHGAAGIGHFLLSLYNCTHEDRWLPSIAGAVVTTQNDGGSRDRLGLCCGVAGCGSFLLDASSVIGISTQRVAQGLGGLIMERRRTESLPPDLMQGEAGIGSFMLRLALPTEPDLVLPVIAAPGAVGRTTMVSGRVGV